MSDYALEREAIALFNQYGAVLRFVPPVREFFLKLALFLNWQDLTKAIK
jgi:hypothetical protein